MSMKKRVPQQHQLKNLNVSQMMQGQHQLQHADRWYEEKTDSSHPTTTHTPDIYAVIVGFEVNAPDIAFKNDIQKLGVIEDGSGDYGHAFFYITKNGRIMQFFSFGPMGNGPKGKAYMGRGGNPDYTIGETVRLFRLLIQQSSYDIVLKETNKIRNEILKGRVTYTRGGPVVTKQKYTAIVNDTCAETARDILIKGITNIPNGTGPVDATFYGSYIPVINAVNPYMWHRNFKRAGYPEVEVRVGKVNWNKRMKELSDGEFVLDPVKDLFIK
jgi:hypothetical protein